MDTIQSSLHLFKRGIFGELRKSKGTRMFPGMSARTKFTLSLGLTCTPIGCKNQQIVRNGKYKKKPKGIE
jgi:hypothetical protein